jgi:YD repeat-containing protein
LSLTLFPAKLFRGATTAMGYGGRAGCGATTTSGSGGTGYVGPHRLTTAYAAGGNWTYAWDAHGNQTVRDAPGTDQGNRAGTATGKRHLTAQSLTSPARENAAWALPKLPADLQRK